jgi:hypothetical protein
MRGPAELPLDRVIVILPSIVHASRRPVRQCVVQGLSLGPGRVDASGQGMIDAMAVASRAAR